MSKLATFLTILSETGEAIVECERPVELVDGACTSLQNQIISFEQGYRQTLPGSPPPLDVPASSWALVMIYRACQSIHCREIDAQTATAMLTEQEGPLENNPSQHYSVDLVFRFLPCVVRFAQTVAEADPILPVFAKWCRHWPLSGVGVGDASPLTISATSEAITQQGTKESTSLNYKSDDRRLKPVLQDECLSTLYTNRVIQTGDRSCMQHPLVRAKLEAATGGYRELLVKSNLLQE